MSILVGKRLTRGVINCNPMNIRKGSNWKGLKLKQKDKSFCQFSEMKWGLRAGIYLLRKYVVKYRLDTAEKIISRWAPEIDGNNTKIYIDRVRKSLKAQTGADNYVMTPDDFVLHDEKPTRGLIGLVIEMCIVESLYKPSAKEIAEAVKIL